MRKLSCYIIAVCLATLAVLSETGRAQQKVTVQMQDAKGQSIGTATLSPTANGVEIQLNLMNLPPGPAGFRKHSG